MIADSCFIIDLMRKDETALEKLNLLKNQKEIQYIASPTVMELAVGVTLAGFPKKERKKIDAILSGFRVLPLDIISAWRAGLEIGRLRKSGRIIDPIDAQIAGIALQHGESIVTRNVKHFQVIKDLIIDSY